MKFKFRLYSIFFYQDWQHLRGSEKTRAKKIITIIIIMTELVKSESENENSDSKRPQFGNRILSDEDNVFQHNAW